MTASLRFTCTPGQVKTSSRTNFVH